jgi:hypothetical protein
MCVKRSKNFKEFKERAELPSSKCDWNIIIIIVIIIYMKVVGPLLFMQNKMPHTVKASRSL